MARNDTLIIRAALEGAASIHRDIEIEASKSLYRLAEAIVSSFGFDFDHAFGFYSGLTPATMMKANPKYELFADMGEANPGVLGVKKIKIAEAFPTVGHAMVFLFDYGDDWHFRVSLRGTATKVAKVRYPRVVASRGEAPEQYPDPDAAEMDRPTYGINPVTGEKIIFKR
jgi:Plasmid pRiA4b ORF-3-like protein